MRAGATERRGMLNSPEAAKRLDGGAKDGLVEVMRQVSTEAKRTIAQAFRDVAQKQPHNADTPDSK